MANSPITLRLSEIERESLEAIAFRKKMTVSAVVRGSILKTIEENDSEDTSDRLCTVCKFFDSEGRLLHVAVLTKTCDLFLRRYKNTTQWVKYVYTWETVDNFRLVPEKQAYEKLMEITRAEKPVFSDLYYQSISYIPSSKITIKRNTIIASIIDKINP